MSCKDRSHLVEQVETLENVADSLTKHVPRAVLDKLAGMMGYNFPGKDTAKFQTYTNISQNYLDQRVAAHKKLPRSSTMKKSKVGE